MTSVIIMGLLAGALFIYGLPHLASGAMGKTYKSPLGDSAMVNVTWGWLAWVIGVLLWHIAPMRLHPRAAFVAVAIGVLVMGWVMSSETVTVPRRRAAKKEA
jgi:hypothetical protein